MGGQEFFRLSIDESGSLKAWMQGSDTSSSTNVDTSNWNYITVTFEIYDYENSLAHVYNGQDRVIQFDAWPNSIFNFDHVPQKLHIGSNPTFLGSIANFQIFHSGSALISNSGIL